MYKFIFKIVPSVFRIVALHMLNIKPVQQSLAYAVIGGNIPPFGPGD